MKRIAYEVTINGERMVTAALPGRGVLTAILTQRFVDEPDPTNIEFSVGGVDSDANEFVDWMKGRAEVGDEFIIRVIEVDEADPPETRRSASDFDCGTAADEDE